jgi:excisionase family DNA binding protein
MTDRFSNRWRTTASAPHFANRSSTNLRTVNEVAERWELSRRTVERLIKSGALRAHRIGRLVRISDADAEDFLQRSRED